MTPDRWRQIQALFHEALAQPAEQRSAFLDDACAGDADLYAQVHALLAADDDPAPILEATPTDLALALTPEPPALADQQIGPYRIIRRIGRGGMGIVFLAHDERLDRPVALKFLPPHLAADEAAKQRFIAEARAASALDHRHICTIYDIGETAAGRLYIAMAYYEGQTLKEKVEAGPLPVDEAVGIATEIAEALQAAHTRGIVHRDVKPGNVLLAAPASGEPDPTVKLLDFGLAKMGGMDLTQTGTTMGTVAYMSPEQARGEAAASQSDLWALGVMLYEMLSGERPFPGDHAQSVIHNILHAEPRPLLALRPEVPGALVQIVDKGLAKNRGARYRRAADVLADLRAASEDGAPASLGRPPIRRARSRKHWALYGGFMATLAVLAALGLFWFSNPAPAYTSIAVLPLDDFSADTTEAYFADGMTEALIAELAQVGALHVISRTSVMAYKNRVTPLPEIARDLGVDALVEGSVTRVGGQVRITVQLIEGATDRHLWAQSYQRDLRDVLSLQSEVARAIVDEIRIQLTPQEQARLATSRTVDTQAYEAYLKGTYHWNKRTQEGLTKAVQYFQEAIDQDPGYARAYAGLASAYTVSADWGFLASKEAAPRAQAVAQKALELDDGLAAPYLALAYVYMVYALDWQAAEGAFKQAITLDPNDATAHHAYGVYLIYMGRFDEGLAMLQRAQMLDPLSRIITVARAYGLYAARRYDEALAQLQEALDMDPDFQAAQYYRGNVYLAIGDYDEAITALQAAVALSETPLMIGALGQAYARAGQRREARRLLGRLDELAGQHYVSPVYRTLIFTGLGEVEQAVFWLEKAYEDRAPEIPMLQVSPEFDALRSHPRFAALLAKMKFPLP